jgi:hypothetical protein
MADSSPEVPPVPVPPVEPTPRAPRAKKPAAPKAEQTEATVVPPIVDLAGTSSTPPSAPPVENPYVQPNPYAQAPAAPSGPPAYAAQPQSYGTPGPSSTLAIVSMILGIVGFVGNSIFGLGLLPGIAAVVTGHMAQKRQPHAKGFWLTGLILGYIAIAGSILIGGFWIVVFAMSASDPYSSFNY